MTPVQVHTEEHSRAEAQHVEMGTVIHPDPIPPPTGERKLFAIGSADGADGPIVTFDPYCRIEDDGTTCPRGWMACNFPQCDPAVGLDCGDGFEELPGGCGPPLIGQDPILDPCDLWYLDKSLDVVWYLRAQDSVELRREMVTRILVLEGGGAAFGFQTCRDMCLDNHECIGGVYRQPLEFDNQLECVLFREAEQPIASSSEPAWPLEIDPALFDAHMLETSLAYSVSVGFFSVCSDFDETKTISPP